TNFGNFTDFKTYPKDSLHLTDFAVFPDQSIYTYQLLTEDSCGHISEPSNIAQTILLQLDSSETFSMLTWSAYEDWKQGIQRYEVQVSNNQSLNWEKVESSIYPVSFIDSITKLSQSNYCYRIAAFRNNDELQSNSNVVCVDTRMNLFVPNAFSPNGDGINDHFQIKGVFINEFNIQIFNRWGEKLFESDSINDGWDGSFKGKTCAFGTYYYSITAKGANGKSNKLSGSLHLLRG
ncbi:MAG: gliding motility-associated C-terminal domain-containing protein, partial [Bacteroidetes bacterium]|nr:gliding motility-associated C-terminal domain-containing protein [Bacteroidota bacterium]